MEYISEYGVFLNENKVPSFKELKATYIDTGLMTIDYYNKLLKEVGKKYVPWLLYTDRADQLNNPYRSKDKMNEYRISNLINFVKVFINRKDLFKGKAKDIYNIKFDHIFTDKDFNFEQGEEKLSLGAVSSTYDVIGKKAQEKTYKTRSDIVEAESNILYEKSGVIAVETNGNNSMAYWTFYHDIKSGRLPPVDNCLTNKGKNPGGYNYSKTNSFLVLILPKEDYFCNRRMMYLEDRVGPMADNDMVTSPYVAHKYIFKKYPGMYKAIMDKKNYNNTMLYDIVKNKGSRSDFINNYIEEEYTMKPFFEDYADRIEEYEKNKDKIKIDFFKRSSEYSKILMTDYLASLKRFI